MKKTTTTFNITDTIAFKQKMLGWCARFNICCFLDNNQYSKSTFECIAATGSLASYTIEESVWENLDLFVKQYHASWIFGHLSYDLKNKVEQLQNTHADPIGFPDCFLFVPETICLLSDHHLEIITTGNAKLIFETICNENFIVEKQPQVHTKPRISKAEYIRIIQQLQQHIQRGDCYEINFCQEFFATGVSIDPLTMYYHLNTVSPNPFSCFYRLNDQYLLCASPERFLQRKENTLISEPIKGTIKRDLTNSIADQQLAATLAHSEKDKSENVMVVDLVRNDLSKIALPGSVHVDELFGIYSFPQVHQMISTITCTLQNSTGFSEIIKACFPMGSMTGAPKKRVMELIEQYESTKRGLFSGSVGYIAPGGNFDWNVVIRSIFYNSDTQYLSFLVGGGITTYSNAENEYEECLLKAAAIKKVLEM